MQLIGMLDSPYVRRTAIALDYLGISFDLEQMSVFSDTEKLSAINPLLKAPTLVCNSGTVLMDSTLIIDYLAAGQSLTDALRPKNAELWQQDVRLTGLALTACDKAVQRVYEERLRPEEKRFSPWIERVESQLFNAWSEIEKLVGEVSFPVSDTTLSMGVISVGVAWTFCTHMLPEQAANYLVPNVNELTIRLERLPFFQKYPFPQDS